MSTRAETLENLRKLACVICGVATLGLGVARADNPALKRVAASELPQFSVDGNLEDLKTALSRQIIACQKGNLADTYQFGSRRVTRQVWCVDTNRELLRLASQAASMPELMDQVRARFEWYQSTGSDSNGQVLFTGYNFPTLTASRTATSEFKYPLYRRPSDLIQATENGKTVWRRRAPNGSLVPYWDRKAIDTDGKLAGRGLEIGYANDLYSVFVFQIQGAGALEFRQEDGTTKKVILNYAGENGQPYYPIGRHLREKGVPPEYLTIPGMRRYFNEHPDELVDTLNLNPSYVFFEESAEGPYGVEKILLTPWHSLALDMNVFRAGMIAFFNTQKPVVAGGEISQWQDFSRLAVAQDTGGAIRGPGRVDIYWGEDAYAELTAGNLKNYGKLFFAVLPGASKQR